MKYKGYVIEVIDGDTFKTQNQKIRLARVKAPEINTPNGIQAKKKLEYLILRREIIYEQVGTSYDRIVAEVWRENININDAMIEYLS